MTRQQQYTLLLANLILWTYGNAIMAIWPLYAVTLGATPALTGSFLALAFLGMSVGALATGWINGRWQRPRTLYTTAILLGIPAALLLAKATAVWHLATGTALGFTAAGVGLALINISAGQHAGAHERGRIFGLLALMMALGAVLGNLIAGPVVDHWGYRSLFRLLGTLWLLQLLPAYWLPQRQGNEANDKGPATVPRPDSQQQPGSLFLLLLVAQLLLSASGFAMNLGRTMLMNVLGFTPTTVTLTAAVGSAGALVLNPLVGRLSDRIERTLLLVLGYGLLAVSLALMAGAQMVPVFLIAALLAAVGNAGRVVEPALVADVVPAPLLDGRMALFGATGWAGAVLGLAGTGYAVQWIGLRPALLVAATIPLMAVLLLGAARYRRARSHHKLAAAPAGHCGRRS